mgnify:CR=1 FL=1
MVEPLTVFESLGPLSLYRTPAAAAGAATRIAAAQHELQQRFAQQPSDLDRARYALEVASTLLLTLRKRACSCELSHRDLACENVDVHQVLADWIEFTRTRL